MDERRNISNISTLKANTVEVTNRFKGLDTIARGQSAEELWMAAGDIVQEAVIKTIPKNKKCKKAKGYLKRSYK